MEKDYTSTANSELTAELFSAGFSQADIEQMIAHGIPVSEGLRQIQVLRSGIPKTQLDRPATVGDGILKLSEQAFASAASYFDEQKGGMKLKKFVPASGAASRMFKFLSVFLSEFDASRDTINSYINKKKAAELSVFLAAAEKLPFFSQVISRMEESHAEGELREKDRRRFEFIRTMLDTAEFDFANKPKGILPFHKYPDRIATAVEEHLREGARYASADGVSHLHFTVSESHRKDFEKIIEEVRPAIEQRTGISIKTNFSYQHGSTDTIAADLNGKPFRLKDGSLFFRPGGHGALIRNLNDIEADLVFIKNIDNVIQNHEVVITLYKKALAGILLQLQTQIFNFLDQIEKGETAGGFLEKAVVFLKEELFVSIPADFSKYTREAKTEFIFEKLHRPIRVCGMVKNEGEPGGGPFWVIGQQGNLSLQIVETSQVEMRDPQQSVIVEKSTHFNPVDIVCAIKDHKGNKFHLPDFVDEERGFIVRKNKDGRELDAYELPGLWNGAMAKWNTIFVEVPLVTFNPVKTVNDLLKPAHQPQ